MFCGASKQPDGFHVERGVHASLVGVPSSGHTVTLTPLYIYMCVCVCAADNEALLAREGAVPVLLAVLKQHMTNADVAEAACTALSNISYNGLCLG